MNAQNNDPLAQKLIDKRKTQALTEASKREQATALAKLEESMPKAILEEFKRMGQRLERMEASLSKEEGINLAISEQNIKFLDVNISFRPRTNQLTDKTSSIHITKGGAGPVEYFGIRNNANQIIWRQEEAKKNYSTEELLGTLI